MKKPKFYDMLNEFLHERHIVNPINVKTIGIDRASTSSHPSTLSQTILNLSEDEDDPINITMPQEEPPKKKKENYETSF